MIKRLDKNNLTGTDMVDKLNEIIDFINDTFLIKVKDRQYGEITDSCIVATESLSSLSLCESIISLKGGVKCPHCGASYYTEKYSESTCVYYPPIWKDGVNVNPDRNKITTHCQCLSCGKEFDI